MSSRVSQGPVSGAHWAANAQPSEASTPGPCLSRLQPGPCCDPVASESCHSAHAAALPLCGVLPSFPGLRTTPQLHKGEGAPPRPEAASPLPRQKKDPHRLGSPQGLAFLSCLSRGQKTLRRGQQDVKVTPGCLGEDRQHKSLTEK